MELDGNNAVMRKYAWNRVWGRLRGYSVFPPRVSRACSSSSQSNVTTHTAFHANSHQGFHHAPV